jgi:hypothetical protein
MPTSALGIDANSDPTLLAGMTHRDADVYPYMLCKGILLEKRQGASAVSGSVGPKAGAAEITYITGSGYGNATTFQGQNSAAVFAVGVYAPREADGKIIHLMSCDTAQSLGPDFVVNGCRAFFGYDDYFVYAPSDADIFFDCDSEIDRAFADGLTADAVYTRVKALVDDRVKKLNDLGAVNEAGTLQDLFDSLRCPSSPNRPGLPVINFGTATAKLT